MTQHYHHDTYSDYRFVTFVNNFLIIREKEAFYVIIFVCKK